MPSDRFDEGASSVIGPLLNTLDLLSLGDSITIDRLGTQYRITVHEYPKKKRVIQKDTLTECIKALKLDIGESLK
jgi:hypothetical protein